MIDKIQNKALEAKVQHLIDTKTKPPGSLGVLEEVALQISLIQQTVAPFLKNPTLIVFAGDHGIATHGEVNPYPQEVTAQMVLNFLRGGAAINVFCKQHDINLKVVDAGVNYDFDQNENLLHLKVNKGTKNYQEEPAMSIAEYQEALEKGGALVQQIFDQGSNCIGFGEMGIGNTSSASLLMAYFLNEPIDQCVGAGTGLTAEGIRNKTKILEAVINKYQPYSPEEALRTFGGFEMVMITGAILKAAQFRMTILIDGFIVTAALLGAYAFNKNCLDYCIATHTSDESGHQKMLEYLNKKALLNLRLRLGEGTGVALAYPLLQSAIGFLNEMASFESAQVSDAN
ncbi:nicotinate-nucleotide--dimethylbenzimidazole phosphoribosyltransferase [Aquimarina sp. ERC-38]|uniref:nicotinate-nucleotide--dimethylbenzimidazole phosphoribosyltransferase n=1 Tax=Aquimarina sp. ERC-38 TaxID=2949996 RepID=UPI0022467D36|nr:nicotinate-nucleotide--dimethylbenzimidazole phosphoribosyltransferase [Aquimarina sp. ERC-38]UZO80775.1 nicotinate-nucleotide--dimethylbenzimidazole phosphoribosyltransferase [Aquimarina sp. ERC-38]